MFMFNYMAYGGFFRLLTFRAIRFMKRYVESNCMITSVYVCVCARVCVQKMQFLCI